MNITMNLDIPSIIYVPKLGRAQRRNTYNFESDPAAVAASMKLLGNRIAALRSYEGSSLSQKSRQEDAKLRRWSTTGTCKCSTVCTSPPSLPQRSPEVKRRSSSLTTLAAIASKNSSYSQQQQQQGGVEGSLYPPKLPRRSLP